MKDDKDIFFHGQPPIPTSSALRGYGYKQPLCACGVADLIKNISLSSFACFCIYFFLLSLSYADAQPPQVCHLENCVTVEVVSKQADLERGLMYRTGLDQNKGMLFVFPNDSKNSFWMKNMHFDLDILWINNEGRIVFIGQNVPACTNDPCPVYTPDQNARYVLELNSGYTASHHWNVGDKIDLKGI
jgi:uncharacterized membrane protein (UPF0127 family)